MIKKGLCEQHVDNSPWVIKASDDLHRCIVCGVDIKTTPKNDLYKLQRHELCESHKENLNNLREFKEKRKSIDYSEKEFHSDIVTSFISGGVAPNFFDNESTILFFKKYCGITLKTAETYRASYLPKIVEDKQEEILKEMHKDDFAIYFDETTDVNGRYILNIMAKSLNGSSTKTFLIDTVELFKTNADNIVDAIKVSVGSIFRNNQFKDKFKVLISDGAAYCLKAGRELKKTFLSLFHIICLCHNLHLLAEEVRNHAPLANKFISILKKVLRKNKTNQSIYREITTIAFPEWPIVTRWCTFINCASFLTTHYSRIVLFIDALDEDEVELKNLIKDPQLYEELCHIKKYKFICDGLKKLESDKLTFVDQVKIIESIKSELSDEYLVVRFEKILSNNPDYHKVVDIINSEQNSGIYKYLTLTTVAVERSFSFLNLLLSETRRNLKAISLFNYLFMRINIRPRLHEYN